MIASKNGPMNVVFSEPELELNSEGLSAFWQRKKVQGCFFYWGRDQDRMKLPFAANLRFKDVLKLIYLMTIV